MMSPGEIEMMRMMRQYFKGSVAERTEDLSSRENEIEIPDKS